MNVLPAYPVSKVGHTSLWIDVWDKLKVLIWSVPEVSLLI